MTSSKEVISTLSGEKASVPQIVQTNTEIYRIDI